MHTWWTCRTTWLDGSVEIELTVDPGAPITALLGELVTMLDALGPTRVDRASSSVHQERSRSVVVVLAHDADEDGGLTIEAGDKSAIISWLSAHEHVDGDDGDDERPMDLRGRRCCRGGAAWGLRRRRLLSRIALGETTHRRHGRSRSTAADQRNGLVLWSWLPWRGEKRVERSRLDFGVVD